jgi:hypothetical protein
MNLRKIEHNEIVNKVTDASLVTRSKINSSISRFQVSFFLYVTVLYTATKEWIKTDCELQVLSRSHAEYLGYWT